MDTVLSILTSLAGLPWWLDVLVFIAGIAWMTWTYRSLRENNRLKSLELAFKEKELAAKNERSDKFVETMTSLRDMVYNQSMVIAKHTDNIQNNGEDLKSAIQTQTKEIAASVQGMGTTIGNRLLILAAEQRGFIGVEQSLIIIEDKIRYVLGSAIETIVTKSLTENHFNKTPNKIRAKVVAQLTQAIVSIQSSLHQNYQLTVDTNPLLGQESDGTAHLARKLWHDLIPSYNGNQFDLEDRIAQAIEGLNSVALACFVEFKTIALDNATESSDLYKRLLSKDLKDKEEKYGSATKAWDPNAQD